MMGKIDDAALRQELVFASKWQPLSAERHFHPKLGSPIYNFESSCLLHANMFCFDILHALIVIEDLSDNTS